MLMRALTAKRNVFVGVAVSVVAIAIAAAATSGDAASETRVHTISALDRLPPATDLSPAAQEWVGRMAARGRGGDPVRRLRTGVGRFKSDIYGYRIATGGICFLYVGFAGNCSDASHVRRTGIQWVIGAGTLVALVADDVAAVTLSIDGRPQSVSPANNIGFAEYEAGDVATITAIDRSGGGETSTIRLTGPAPVSP